MLFHAQRHELNKDMDYGEQCIIYDGMNLGDLVGSRKEGVWEEIGKNYWVLLMKNIVSISHNKT